MHCRFFEAGWIAPSTSENAELQYFPHDFAPSNAAQNVDKASLLDVFVTNPFFVFVTNPFFYLSQISFPTSTLISTLIRDQTACTYDHLMKPSQVLWLQKYLLEWVDLSLLGLSRVFRIKTNRLCGVVWTRFENSVIVSFLAVSWMVVSRVFLFKTNRLCCVMWRRFENVIQSFVLGFQCFLKILSKYSCWAFTCFFWVFLANTGGLCCVTSWKFLRNQDLQIILPQPYVPVRSFPDMDRWTLGWQLGVMCPKF